MRELYKRVKSLSILLLVFIAMPAYLLLEFGGSAFAVDAYSSQTWQTDMEWEIWSLSNIELNGSDSGIRLKQEDSGYAKSGEATYKLTPGGNNKWIKAVADGENAGSVPSKYVWVPVYWGESVSQIDSKSGEIVKEWSVGEGPSRTAIGCNNDVWVANSWSDSISHIIPGENKVTTKLLDRSVAPILTSPRAISILCGSGSGGDTVVVGANRYLIKFSAQDFDSLPDSGDITDIQQGNTLTVAPSPRKIIGSTISADVDDGVDGGSRYVYVALDGGKGPQIANRPNYKVDIGSFTVEAGWPVSLGYNVVVGDNLGNVWKDGVCGRFYVADDSTDKLCSHPSPASGVVVMPDHPGGGDKLAYFQFHNSSFNPLLHVANLNNNNTANPTISGIIETTYSGTNHTGAIVRGGALGYDDDYDIWYIPNNAFWIAEFKKSENYSMAHKIDPTQTVASQASLVRGYSDFVGDAVSDATPAQTLIEYSTDNTNYHQTNADGSFPDEISSSQDLYIRIKMTGSGTNSPLLRSLKVEYEPESQASLQIVRKTYNSILARDSDTGESTFEKNETAYVRLVLFQAGLPKDDTTLTDRLSNFKDPKDYRFKEGCSGVGTVLNPTVGTNEIVFNDLDIPSGLSCIDYEYTVQ